MTYPIIAVHVKWS